MVRLAVLVALWLVTSSALAGNEVPPPGHHEDHVIAGMKAFTVTEEAKTRGEVLALTGYGAGGFAEATLLGEKLAIEVAFVVTRAGDEVSWAGEPVIKVPLHARAWLEPYVAAGPLFLHVVDGEEQRYWLGGGQAVFGSYFWIAEHLGLDFDFSLGAARGPDMAIYEMVLAVGPVVRK